MGDKTQIGARVDEELYERFKKAVEKKHGRTRGVLSHEVENALRNYVEADNPTDPLARIENDVATIKAQLSESDGGEVATPPRPSSNGNTHTHTDDDTDDGSKQVADEFDRLEAGHPSTDDVQQEDDGDDTPSKPGRKASKAKKAAFVFDKMSGGGGIVVSPKAIENVIDAEWGFGDRATSDIVDRIYSTCHAEAVNKGSAWFVAIAKTPEARDAAIDEWQDTPEDTTVVPEANFDGFDKTGTPTGVR